METTIKIEYSLDTANDLIRILLKIVPEMENLGMKVTVQGD